MRILIVNDDGIFAPGIAQLALAAKDFGEVTVVAPKGQCSAMSHRIILNRPLAVQEESFPVEGVSAYSVDGTPADCVRAALAVLMDEKPDIVFSGINRGYNVGYDVIYSGTVGAAMEALMAGIPAIAFSRHHEGTADLMLAYIHDIITKLLPLPISESEIWNVNFPGCPVEDCAGIVWDCTLAREDFYNGRMRIFPADGGWEVSYPVDLEEGTPAIRGEEGTDLRAVLENKIAIGRLHCMVL